jgi:DnaJ-class molecular chaperone
MLVVGGERGVMRGNSNGTAAANPMDIFESFFGGGFGGFGGGMGGQDARMRPGEN